MPTDEQVKCIVAAGIGKDTLDALGVNMDDKNPIDLSAFEGKKVEFLEANLQRKRETMLSAIKKDELRGRIDNHLSQGGSSKEALISIIGRTVEDAEQKGISLEGRKNAIKAEAFGKMQRVMQNYAPKLNELLPGVKQNTSQQDLLIKALFKESSGSPEIDKMAAEIMDVLEELRVRMNEAGAQIKKLEEYGLPQHWQVDKMLKHGKDAWVKDMENLLNWEKTKVRREDLGDIYENIVGEQTPEEALSAPRIKGSYIERFNRERKLIPRNADAYFSMQQKYGSDDLYGTLIKHVDDMSAAIAAVETFGPNPDEAFGAIKAYTQAIYNQDQLAAGKALDKDVTITADAMYTLFTGKLKPGSMGFAKAGADLRSLTVSSLSGFIALSQLSDIPISQWRMLFNGMGLSRAVKTTLRHIRNIFGKMDQQDAARLGVISDSMLGYHSRIEGIYDEDHMVHSGIRKASEAMFRLGMVTRWTEAGQIAFVKELSYSLGDIASKSFKNLDFRLKRALNRYGIDEAGWEQMRKATDTDGGGNFIDPSKIADRELRTRARAMYAQETKLAVPEPGLRESTFFRKQAAGTVAGELMRSTGTFKSFSMTYWNTLLRPLIPFTKASQFSEGNKAMTALFVMGIMPIYGYVSMLAKQIARGETPNYWPDDLTENPTDFLTKLYLPAFTQSGGLGIMGDFLFADESRFGGGFIESLAGPTLGNVAEIKRMIVDMPLAIAEGDTDKFQKLLSMTAEKVRRMAPISQLSTLWWLKAASDKLVAEPLVYDKLNPKGARYRRKRQRKKEREGKNNGLWWDDGDLIGNPLDALPDFE